MKNRTPLAVTLAGCATGTFGLGAVATIWASRQLPNAAECALAGGCPTINIGYAMFVAAITLLVTTPLAIAAAVIAFTGHDSPSAPYAGPQGSGAAPATPGPRAETREATPTRR